MLPATSFEAELLSDAAKLPSLRFDTAELPAREQYETWRQAVGVTHEITTPGLNRGSGLAASSEIWRLGQSILSFRKFPAMFFARDRGRARRDGLDHYSLLLMAQGVWTGDADGQDTVLRSGEIAMFDLARPVDNHVSESASLRLMLPRDRLDMMLPPGGLVGSSHGAPFRDGLTQVLADHLAALHRGAGQILAMQGALLEQATLNLVAACLAPSADRLNLAAHDIAAARLRTIRRHIEARLHEPALGADSICRDCAISRSVLYRQFEALGGVQAYIQARRLARARAVLAQPGGKPRIGDVAFAHGFTSEAHFARSFRRAFGHSPSEARAAAQPEPRYRSLVAGPR